MTVSLLVLVNKTDWHDCIMKGISTTNTSKEMFTSLGCQFVLQFLFITSVHRVSSMTMMQWSSGRILSKHSEGSGFKPDLSHCFANLDKLFTPD